jgi:hypothetical protein
MLLHFIHHLIISKNLCAVLRAIIVTWNKFLRITAAGTGSLLKGAFNYCSFKVSLGYVEK